MDPYVIRDGKKLRCGYTTGSCAAAAAKAAAWMLLSGKEISSIHLTTPKGIGLDLPILEITREDGSVRCAVRKDSGDDPDVTNGTLIFASVFRREEPGILIDGGEGVGRVTKPGLDQPVGAAAINSVPRQMIRENIEELCKLFDVQDGLSVIISAPEGEELARRTFNSRLGIIGGISILGTSGIVEPMSDQALIDTIRLELKQRRLNGTEHIVLTPGNYGMDFIRQHFSITPNAPVMTSNFIGDALDICRELEFRSILLVGHIGKLVKLAGGMMNTHSRYGDCRMEILAAYAAAAGLSGDKVDEILSCVTCDEAIRIIKEDGCFEQTMSVLIRRIEEHLRLRTGGDTEIGVIVFSNVYGVLCQTDNARSLLDHQTEE